MSEQTPLLSKSLRETPGFLSTADYILILPALLLNMFLAAFESTIAASTQAAVGATFHASDNIAWIATSYLIVSTAVQPLYGRASDLFGRTKVYMFSLVFFSLGCLGCGLALNMGQMIAARALCGIGGGGLITISQVCAWDLLPLRHRPVYQAVNNVSYGIGAAVGASLGGLFSDSIGWRWGYLAPVPISIFSIAVFFVRARPKLAVLHGEEKPKSSMRDIDILGSTLLMFAIAILMLVVNLGGDEIAWSSPLIPVLLIAFLVSSAFFFRHERRFPLPVLPMNLVRSRHMVSQVGLNLFGAMTIFGTLYSIPVYFQSVFLTSATVASRRLLYPTLTAPIGSIMTGLFLHRYPDKKHLGQRIGALALLGGTIAMLKMTYETQRRGEWWYILHLIWVHLGMGILFISSLLDILASSGPDHAAATSLIFLIRAVGTVLGISGSQAVLQNVLLRELRKNVGGPGSRKVIKSIRESVEYLKVLEPDVRAAAIRSFTTSFRAVFIVLIGVAGCAVLSAILGIGAHKRQDEDEEMPPEVVNDID